MKSTAIKLRYRKNIFFVVFCLIVLLPNLIRKLIHNRCKQMHTCMQANNWVPVIMFQSVILCCSALKLFISSIQHYNPSNLFAYARLVSTRHVTKYFPAKTGDYPRIFPNFQAYARCEKDLKDNKHNSLHLGRKYAQKIRSWKTVLFSEQIMLWTNIRSYFRTKWWLLFLYSPRHRRIIVNYQPEKYFNCMIVYKLSLLSFCL